MLIRLLRKLANSLDGIDVSQVSPGEVMELTDAQGALLIAEAWAEPVPDEDAQRMQPERLERRARA